MRDGKEGILGQERCSIWLCASPVGARLAFPLFRVLKLAVSILCVFRDQESREMDQAFVAVFTFIVVSNFELQSSSPTIEYGTCQ